MFQTTGTFDLLTFGVEVLVLLALSFAMLLPFVTHRENVLYGDGVLSLVASLLFLTAGTVVEYAYWAGRPVEWFVASYVLYTVGSVAIAASMWYFARDFIRTRPDDEPITRHDEDVGGFEDAR